ncbi:PfkB family carbohydrate kinase [Streptomyces antimycoticus]|uniref:PfkB family carbohydrate kinase n=1 Tax=Streptomyces antimycoticus TaxID=68175 RepID=UPI003689C7E8
MAANICFRLGQLGLRPLLVSATGADFAEYRAWLEAHGVDTGTVPISASLHTARFICTTNREQKQIATFYAGAMAEARGIDLCAVLAGAAESDLVLVGRTTRRRSCGTPPPRTGPRCGWSPTVRSNCPGSAGRRREPWWSRARAVHQCVRGAPAAGAHRVDGAAAPGPGGPITRGADGVLVRRADGTRLTVRGPAAAVPVRPAAHPPALPGSRPVHAQRNLRLQQAGDRGARRGPAPARGAGRPGGRLSARPGRAVRVRRRLGRHPRPRRTSGGPARRRGADAAANAGPGVRHGRRGGHVGVARRGASHGQEGARGAQRAGLLSGAGPGPGAGGPQPGPGRGPGAGNDPDRPEDRSPAGCI